MASEATRASPASTPTLMTTTMDVESLNAPSELRLHLMLDLFEGTGGGNSSSSPATDGGLMDSMAVVVDLPAATNSHSVSHTTTTTSSHGNSHSKSGNDPYLNSVHHDAIKSDLLGNSSSGGASSSSSSSFYLALLEPTATTTWQTEQLQQGIAPSALLYHDDRGDNKEEDEYEDEDEDIGARRGRGRGRSARRTGASGRQSVAGKQQQHSTTPHDHHRDELRAALDAAAAAAASGPARTTTVRVYVPANVASGYSGREEQVAAVRSLLPAAASSSSPTSSSSPVISSSSSIAAASMAAAIPSAHHDHDVNATNTTHNERQLKLRQDILDALEGRDSQQGQAATWTPQDELECLERVVLMAHMHIAHLATKVALRHVGTKGQSSFSSRNKGCLRAAGRAIMLLDAFRTQVLQQQAQGKRYLIPRELVGRIIDECLPPTSARPPSDSNPFVSVYTDCMNFSRAIRAPQISDIDHAWFRVVQGMPILDDFVANALRLPGRWAKSFPAGYSARDKDDVHSSSSSADAEME